MDADPSSQRRTTSRKRIASPRAAKSGTELSNSAAATGLRRLRKVFLDELDDDAPAFFVALKRLCAARERDLVKAGFGNGEHDAVGDLFQGEFDERRRFVRIIHAGLDGIGVPAKGEEAFGFDAVHGDFERDMLMLLLELCNFSVDGSPYNLPSDAFSRLEGSVELDAEPGGEFLGVGYCAPDTFERGAEKNLFLDAVGGHWFLDRFRHVVTQPPGCILAKTSLICNHKVARLPACA